MSARANQGSECSQLNFRAHRKWIITYFDRRDTIAPARVDSDHVRGAFWHTCFRVASGIAIRRKAA
jgi:hypothetical protein